MATTTPNFGWSVPTSTDLVKDGATAIETLGDSIDASMVDLKGGTSGQILAKNSNTDMDFIWIANDQGDLTAVSAGVGITVTNGTGPIPTITNSSTDLITTAGDILYGTAADTVARLGIGTAAQVLRVNSGATAPEWATVSTAPTWTSLSSGTPSGSTYTVSSLSGYNQFFVMFESISTNSSAGPTITMRFNADTGANYDVWAHNFGGGDYTASGATSLNLLNIGANLASGFVGGVWIQNSNSTGNKFGTIVTSGNFSPSDAKTGTFRYAGTSVISSISIITSAGSFDAGTLRIFGAN